MIKEQVTIPILSIMKENENTFHYVDSFESQYIVSMSKYDIIRIGSLFLTSGPSWANNLMAIRNKIVGIFGLKTTIQKNNDDFIFEVGKQLDIFKLFNVTENELIIGEDDKHLCFRVSILLDGINNETNKSKIIITTMVEFKNLFGKLYFWFVKPFHHLIVKGTLKDMIQKINKN